MRKVEWRLFFAWNEEAELAYLEQRAREGWLLTSYLPLRYEFRQAEPGEYVYQFDYFNGPYAAGEERKAFITAFGWEHILSFAGWQYYRARQGTVESDELYTDAASLQGKYNHLLRLFAGLAVTNLAMAASVLSRSSIGVPGTINLAVALLLTYAAYRTWRRLRVYRDQLR